MADKQKTVLVTGGSGFIGSNFLHYFQKNHPEWNILNLDKLTYAGNPRNLDDLPAPENYEFLQADICDAAEINALFARQKFHGVIHFAAESHVDNSISNPDVFVRTNVNGTFHLLDACRRQWMKGNFEPREEFRNARFHHVSTDEVYGTLGETGLFTETTPYAPNSPYSASKAGSDMLVRAFHHTYGLNTVISNCSNNYGPRQHKEKLIPTILRKALSAEPIPIYGDGKNIRDWLYVDDHCSGIALAFLTGKAGEVYNIGGENERRNIDIAKTITGILDQEMPQSVPAGGYGSLISFVSDRPGHDFRYAIDASKIRRELGWKPAHNFDSGIRETIRWYLKHRDRLD